MSELLEVIRQEVEAREISEGVKTNVNLEKVNPKPQRTPTANALLSQDGPQTFKLNVRIVRVVIFQPLVKASPTQRLVLKF